MTDVNVAPVRPLRELLPHVVWEAVLLLGAIGVTAALLAENSDVFSRRGVWGSFAVLGFAATGLALSFRTATPNFAVGGVAGLAGYVYADQGSLILSVLAGAGIGLVLALIVGLTGLPAWAVTFPAGIAAQAVLLQATEGRTVIIRDGGPPTGFGLWAVVFGVVSVAGAVALAVPPVRRLLAAPRPAGGELGTFRPAKLVAALVGLVGSSALAGLAGGLQAEMIRASSTILDGQFTIAFAVVLLAGVSPFGRRAGILGVLLAVTIVDFTRRLQLLHGAQSTTVILTVAAYALLGLVVVWLVELIGRRTTPLATAHAGPGAPPPGPLPAPYPVGVPFPAAAPAAPPGTVPFGAAPPGTTWPGGPVIPAQYTPGRPPTAPMSGPPMSGPPMSAPPSSGPPVSGPPVSEPPPAGGVPWQQPGQPGQPGQPPPPPPPPPGPPAQPPAPPQAPPPSWPPAP